MNYSQYGVYKLLKLFSQELMPDKRWVKCILNKTDPVYELKMLSQKDLHCYLIGWRI